MKVEWTYISFSFGEPPQNDLHLNWSNLSLTEQSIKAYQRKSRKLCLEVLTSFCNWKEEEKGSFRSGIWCQRRPQVLWTSLCKRCKSFILIRQNYPHHQHLTDIPWHHQGDQTSQKSRHLQTDVLVIRVDESGSVRAMISSSRVC